tara:strand:+ start:240 stop:470 length:231 start_codon:yes stop_codon:yes gene_type:complete
MREDWPTWAKLPAPRRGEIVKEIADALKAKKVELGRCLALEVGKVVSEGEGEVFHKNIRFKKQLMFVILLVDYQEQ